MLNSNYNGSNNIVLMACLNPGPLKIPVMGTSTSQALVTSKLLVPSIHIAC